MKFDGSLKFDTKIDTTGFESGTSSLKEAIDKLTAAIERLSSQIVNAFDGMQRAAEEAGSGAEQTASKVDGITEAAKRAKEETESLQEQMNKITVTHPENVESIEGPDMPKEVELTGDYKTYGDDVRKFVDEYAAGMETTEQHTNEFKAEIESLTQKLKEMESQGLYFGDDEYDETFLKLARIKQALADYKQEMLSPTPDVEVPVKLDMDSFAGQKQQLKNQLAELEKQGVTLGAPEYDSVYVALQNVTQAEADYKKSLLEADQGQKQAKKSADSMRKSMDKAGKSAKGAGKGMGMLGAIGRSILFSLIFKAISMVTTAVKEGFQNLAQYSQGANATLSSLISSLLYLKNSFAAAFAPVLDFVVPALNAMIDALARALAWVGQLIAALTGKDTFAKAVKTQEDYAAGLKKTGSAAKKAGKDAKKSLAPFDQLNQLTSRDSSGSGAGGASGTDPSQMFETVKVDSDIASIADRMKEAFSRFLSWTQANFGPSLSKVWNDMIPNIENFKAVLSGIWNDLGTLGEPLKAWLDNDFVPFLNQIILTGGEIINGLFDSFNMVFSDIWNLAVFPILQNFATTGLPLITQFATELVSAIGVLFEQVKDIFDRIWRDAAAPALALLAHIWTDCVNSLKAAWDEFGRPIFDAIKEAIEKTGDTTKKIWDTYIKPVVDTAMEVAGRLWDQHVKPLMDHLIEFGARLIQVALDIYNNMILPMISWFADELGPGVSAGLQIAIDVFGVMVAAVSGAIDAVLLVLNGLLDFIHTGFTEGWDVAWSKVSSIFKNIFNGIIDIAERAINFIVDSLNGLSFDVPDFVPGIGGKQFGFDISGVHLPRLATGTVVPPRAGEFAAILGDNNRETEVVSPLSTIQEALENVMKKHGGFGGGDITLTVNLDGDVVYKSVVKRNQQKKAESGKNPLLA